MLESVIVSPTYNRTISCETQQTDRTEITEDIFSMYLRL